MLSKEIIERTVILQREFFQKEEKFIDRKLMDRIKIQNKFAIIISGVRRSGKSTLMKSIAKKVSSFYFVCFEDSRLAGFDLEDFERLEEVFKKTFGESDFFFFDEIQLVDKWEFYIRNLLNQNKYVVITGSNASLLSREFGTKLTGRNLRYELFPFSYREFLLFSNKKDGLESFKEYLLNGGFPEYLFLKDPKILQDLFADCLFRDIAIRHKIRNVRRLNELAVFLLTNVTSEFSYTALKKMFGFGSTNSVSQLISFLEESYVLFTLPKFDYSLKKQIMNPKKIYAIDNGLIVQNGRSFSNDFGKLLENVVFVYLKSICQELFYFREKNECDFVVRYGSKIVEAYQVCYKIDDFNRERELNGLIEALKKFNLKNGTILTLEQDDEFQIEGRKVFVKPVWKWLIEN